MNNPVYPRQPLRWTVGHSASIDAAPSERVPAQVPGAVQLDWATSQKWDSHCYGDNYKQYHWMEDVYWHYSAVIDAAPKSGQRLFFVSKGIDYRFTIFAGEKRLYEQEGMFRPVEIDLTAAGVGKDDTLRVTIWPIPKSRPDSGDRDRVQANQSCKPAVSYGWDFHPRLVPSGIWDDTYLETRPECHLTAADVFYELSDSFDSARVTAEIDLSAIDSSFSLTWRLFRPDGQALSKQSKSAERRSVRFEIGIDNPTLWWPNGQGEPALYKSIIELKSASGEVVDRQSSKIGIRRIRLVMAPDQWDHPKFMPKTRSNPPVTLEINGRAIFAKGSNWVPPDIFFGRLNESVYRKQLEMVHAANMNILRVWGGGIVNKSAFFDICDELGILIWQEFPLACNRYEGTAHYLSVLDAESRAIIQNVRRHACLAIWCGGNELYNSWSGMTDQDLPIRLLNKNCFDLDPRTPFLPTSPIMGVGHGNYVFRAIEGEEVFTMFANAQCTAYTEFGCPAPAGVGTLKTIIPEAELFPPRSTGSWLTHHAFESWSSESWLFVSVIEDYFGPSPDLQTLVERGQLLQSEGYKCLFEEARRQKPRASMALNWCLNEPWPTAANNSLINWPATPKPALKAVSGACRPLLASAKIPKFRWYAGETFEAELWLLNDSPQPVAALKITATLQLGDGPLIGLLTWQSPALQANENAQGASVRYKLPKLPDGPIRLQLRGPEGAGIDSEYCLLYAAVRPAEGKWKPGTMNV